MNNLNVESLLSVKLKRRNLLIGAGGLAGFAIASQFSDRVIAQPSFSGYPFTLGVASGDPLPDSVILWTRLAPDPIRGGGMPQQNIQVRWQVATDPSMRQVLRRGVTVASPDLGHSVHVDVSGLEPDRYYWYQFKVGNEISPIGRTRTAPAKYANVNQLNFAFASCQEYQSGFYTAYKFMAGEDLNFVVHLGDYIYEGGINTTRVRQHNSPEIITLEDYRNRHALYKTDPDLQAAHGAFPWIVTWDDHEVDNNWAGFVPEDPDIQTPEQFRLRRRVAFQAYYEHMPIRVKPSRNWDELKLYRQFTFGKLASFNVLDTRQYRSDQPCLQTFPSAPDCPDRKNPLLTMTGTPQERWLLQGLEESPTRWNVIAQQIWFGQVDYQPGYEKAFNMDQWDGYPAARQRIIDFIDSRRPKNPVIITGDWHSFCVQDIKKNFDDPNSKTVATEFAGTSISSLCPWASSVQANLSENPHIKFFNGDVRGYVRCQIKPNVWQSDYRTVSTTTDRFSATINNLASFIVENGRAGAQQIS
ncbi:alkaline phosphatase D family protein [Nostoc sp. FACHB-152]|uniref:alkaline phosphatase D family protein n=1 Tax=unclassified Nostoc TaxID=2593658 RepID=UPI0016858191|nr:MULTISPECIES: alkaline phosphatase D family protein [unclassified Nostoc]MBD2451049.1 alkaline phosphatase D family protein [Nostoc sp. FACHB-152]MBD2471087.1 alkaline phosphatase D family protein [Nostoc sp. FACHB-145]